MSKHMRQVIALIAAISIGISSFSPNVWASEAGVVKEAGDSAGTMQSSEIEVVNDSVEISGNNSVGGLISQAIEQGSADESVSNWGVTSVEVTGSTANVNYFSASPAQLVVAVYDEDTDQMCAEGTAKVSSGKGTIAVKMTGKIPQYFAVKAFLVNEETGEPLCSSYSTSQYTKAMRQLTASTVEDYDPELVVNLDSNPENNFLVYNDSVKILDTEQGQNTISCSDGIYTIASPGEDALSIQSGDIISYTNSSGDPVILRVRSVSKDGDVITITDDDSLSLDEVFQIVKIDTSDTSVGSEGELQTQGSGKNTSSVTLNINDNLFNKEGDVAELSGSISGSLTIGVECNLNLAPNCKEFIFKIEDSLEGELSVKGKMTGAIELGEVDISPFAGVYIKFTPSVVLRISGEVHPHFKISSAVGRAYDDKNGWHSVNEPVHVDECDIDLEGKIYFGVSLEPRVCIVSERFSVGLKAEAGIEFNMKDSLKDSIKNEYIAKGDAVHECDICFDGTAKLKFTLSGDLKTISEKLSVEFKPINPSIDLGKCYLSRLNGEFDFGFGVCPHCRYKTYILVTDKTTAKPVQNCTLTIKNKETGKKHDKNLKTDEKGLATDFFAVGTYTVDAKYERIAGSAELLVFEQPSSVAVELDIGKLVRISAVRPDGTPAVGAEVTGTNVPDGTVTDNNGYVEYIATAGKKEVKIYDEKSDSEWTQEFRGGEKELSFEAELEPILHYVNVFIRDETGVGVDTKVTCGDQIAWSFYGKIPAQLKLPTGTHTVHVENPDGEDVEKEVKVNRADASVSVILPAKLCPVTVTVLKKDGTPYSGISIYGTGLDSTPYTDSEGKAVFEVRKGYYAFYVQSNDNFATQSLNVSGKTDITLVMEEAWTDWSYNEDTKTLRIWGAGPMDLRNYRYKLPSGPVENVVISGLITVSKNALTGWRDLKNVVIDNSVITIKDNAFENSTALTSINIPDSVTTVGVRAFANCTGLTTVKLSNHLSSTGRSAFSGCTNLKTITIPNGTRAIGNSCFYNCTGLKSVYLPPSVSTLDSDAFYQCSGLNEITIPDGVTSIGISAFHGCSSLTSVTIPENVTAIDQCAFKDCTGLANVTICDGVARICSSAFCGCTSLTEITIPNSVTDIDGGAFENCTSLKSAVMPFSATIRYKAFLECSALEDVSFSEGITEIRIAGLEEIPNLKRVTIPDSVITIGSNAFSGCNGLTSVTIPDSVTTIEYNAFGWCSGLSNVEIGNNVTSIGSGAFWHCTSLTSVTIPDSVTTLGGSAFCNCSNLSSIVMPGTIRLSDSTPGVFDKCPALEEVIFSESSREISGMRLNKISNLKRVSIPEGVTTIGEYVFAGCEGLTSVTIPDSVTSIEASAFNSCTGLNNVHLGKGVTSIGNRAFYGCDGLNEVMIPDSVSSVGESAFESCSGLSSIILPASVDLGKNSFKNCYNLQEVYLTEGNSENRALRLNKITKMKHLTIMKGVTGIGEYICIGCKNLTEVTIPDSITEIEKGAFSGCTGLTSVNIGSGVTEVKHGAFEECTSLYDVYYNGTEEQWKKINIYQGNDALGSATIHFNS